MCCGISVASLRDAGVRVPIADPTLRYAYMGLQKSRLSEAKGVSVQLKVDVTGISEGTRKDETGSFYSSLIAYGYKGFRPENWMQKFDVLKALSSTIFCVKISLFAERFDGTFEDAVHIGNHHSVVRDGNAAFHGGLQSAHNLFACNHTAATLDDHRVFVNVWQSV